MKPEPGTYALILQSHSDETIQIGRWGLLDLQPGYYLYVGSAFGPGGVRARVSRHWRADKSKYWHIDYLREYITPVEAWISYGPERLEHKWAQAFCSMPEIDSFRAFGCSDCNCFSHLFHFLLRPDSDWFTKTFDGQTKVTWTV